MSSPKPDLDTPPPIASYNTPPALIAFTLAVLVLCFVAFSIVYLCRYCFASVIQTWAFQRTASGSLIRLSPNRPRPRGLNDSLLEMFPTFLYGSVKDLRKEKTYSLECAICLLEFEDDSMLRLLTVCCHVFHKECIDLWLSSNKTCPVCRTDLDSSPNNNEMPKFRDNNSNDGAQEGMVSSTNDDIRIDIREGEGASVGDQSRDHERDRIGLGMQQQEEQRLPRSHSTGHSIVMIRRGGGEKDDDKYTLRLPEHVIRGGHNFTRSCASEKEMTGPAAPCNSSSSSSNCGSVQRVYGSSSHGPARES